MPQILRTASALQDLDDIWDSIAIENDRPGAASRLMDEMNAALHLLLAEPHLGEEVNHLRADTRRWIVHKNYLLFYDVVGDDIRLLRVLHAARLIQPEDLGPPETDEA
jgi:addiction module RelE/StbE family toxin